MRKLVSCKRCLEKFDEVAGKCPNCGYTLWLEMNTAQIEFSEGMEEILSSYLVRFAKKYYLMLTVDDDGELQIANFAQGRYTRAISKDEVGDIEDYNCGSVEKLGEKTCLVVYWDHADGVHSVAGLLQEDDTVKAKVYKKLAKRMGKQRGIQHIVTSYVQDLA
ncbi:hypothetical protein GGF46_002009 [Coemansia sp. RSA 552]|nr:hypothetical protein GGF46_002009 [Coemansia sp. RSA 552]